MKLALAALAFSILSITLAKPLLAQTASDPLLSMKRLSIAAGVDREIIGEAAAPEDRWLGVFSMAYNVLSLSSGPRVALIARFDQPLSEGSQSYGVVGVRVTLWDGSR